MKLDAGTIRCLADPCASTGAMYMLDGRVVIAYHRVLERAPEDAWSTDRDELGVLVVDERAGTLHLESRPIPVDLPMRATGAREARRELDLVGLSEAGHVLAELAEPFRDARGWGTERVLYEHAVATEMWTRVEAGVSRRAAGGMRYGSGAALGWRLHAPEAEPLELDAFDAWLRAHPALAGVPIEQLFVLRGVPLATSTGPQLVLTVRAFVEGAPYRDLVLSAAL